MAEPVRSSFHSFALRRRRLWLLLITAVLFLAVSSTAYTLALADVALLSGWLLATSVLFLACFNIRKKLTYPPLFKAALWTQLHVYVGVFAGVVFLIHTGGDLPEGFVDVILFVLFILVFLTGVIGLYLTRSIPRSLSNRGNEVIFERIPQFIQQVRGQAEDIILKSIAASDDGILAELYESHLASFFARHRNLFFHALRSDRTSRKVRHEIEASQRYLSDADKALAQEIFQLVQLKDDLDFHYARQGLLKMWLFVHIPLTVMLLFFAVAHVFLAYAFSGSLW